MIKKKEEDDKGKLDDMATKDSVKKDDEKKEEKPDTRAMYAKIAMIKNKLRSAGQRDPMVMGMDACEETMGPIITTKRKDIPYEPKLKQSIPILIPKRKKDSKMKTEERTPAKDDPAFDEMRPGGSNSQYNADGTKKSPFKPGVEKKEIDPKKGKFKKRVKPVTGGDSQRPQTGKPIPKKEPKYNPYGTGTANPENMSGSTGP